MRPRVSVSDVDQLNVSYHPGRCSRPIRRFGTIPGNEDTFAALSTRTVIQIKPALISHDLPFPPVIRTPPRMVSEEVRNPSKSAMRPDAPFSTSASVRDDPGLCGYLDCTFCTPRYTFWSRSYLPLSPEISRDLPRSHILRSPGDRGRSNQLSLRHVMLQIKSCVS